jgi:hypothetical protein
MLENQNLLPSNYADDNTVTIIGDTREEVISKVRQTVRVLASWFKDNLMKANIDKFQFMFMSPNIKDTNTEVKIEVDDIVLTSQDRAKLLGVSIDKDLRLDQHVKTLCTKANAKLQILKRCHIFLVKSRL